MSIVAKWLDASGYHFVLDEIVLDGDPAPPLKGPLFGPCLLLPNGRPSQLLLSLSVMISCCRLNWLPSFLIYIMYSVLYSVFSYCSGLPPGVDTVYVEIFDEVRILSVFIVLSSVLIESYCVLSYPISLHVCFTFSQDASL